MAEPNCVLAAIGRVREVHESGAAITRYQKRETIAQLFGVEADKIAHHPTFPGTTRFFKCPRPLRFPSIPGGSNIKSL